MSSQQSHTQLPPQVISSCPSSPRYAGSLSSSSSSSPSSSLAAAHSLGQIQPQEQFQCQDHIQRHGLALQRQQYQAQIHLHPLHSQQHPQDGYTPLELREAFAPQRQHSFSGSSSLQAYNIASVSPSHLQPSNTLLEDVYDPYHISLRSAQVVPDPPQHPPLSQQQQPRQQHLEQQQQHQTLLHLPTSLSSSSISPLFLSPPPASPVVLPHPLYPVSASSMGVLTMPPLPLHPQYPFSSNPHPSAQLQQQQSRYAYSRPKHPYQVRHHSLPNLDLTCDLLKSQQQRQPQQSQQYQQHVRQQQQLLNTSSPFYHPDLQVEQVESSASRPDSMRQESRQAHPPSFVSSSSSSSLSSLPSPSSFFQGTNFGETSSEMDNCDPSIGSGGTFSASNYPPWTKADSLLGHGTHHTSGTAQHCNTGQSDEIIRRLSYSSAGSEMNTRASSMMDENDLMSAYSLDVRIIQKKDQLEELSAIGGSISAPVVEEVRTGQQFLIKLHLSRNGAGHTSRLPSLRVSRRVAINTSGEFKAEPDPLTLEVAVHLAKSGQVRKGACAKCCHKYGPSSPILLLLDPFSPSASDPAIYAHIDTTTGSITMLAKVVCSSTDHGERGNKDRYIFEFKLKRPSNGLTTHSNINGSSSMDSPEDDGETIATCFTPPIMASGHHKAKRMYPHPRLSKAAKGGPTPKTKVIKRHKSEPNIMTPFQGPADGTMVDHSGFSSTMPFLAEQLSQVPMMGSYSNHSTDANMQPHSATSQQSGGYMSSLPHPSAPMQPPHQSQPFPRITAVRPDHGPIRKTTDVVLRGGFFREGMVPYFGCFPAQDVVVETTNLIICKAPESPLPGAVSITIYDSIGNSFADLGQFTYTDDSETELLILQLQLRLAHRALEYLHTQATGRKGNAVDILKDIPGLSTSPRSGSLLMDASEAGGTNAHVEEIPQMLSLSQVEQGVLDMLDQLPYGMDISLQLEDGSNLLHLSLLLGFDTLTERLIEEGCDIEAQDAWSMTPLMYAVLKGNEPMTRSLVFAGASSSGARTPQQFYGALPWVIEPSSAIVSILSTSCSRYSGGPRSFPLDSVVEELDQDGAHDESGRSSSSAGSDDNQDSDSTHATITRRSATMPYSDDAVAKVDTGYTRALESGPEMMTRLADALQGIHTYHGMPPLDQQGLPPFHTVESDGSITINNQVIKTSATLGAEIYTNVNPESGYHSGILTEVQKRLTRLHMATLPSEGVQMTVLLKKLSPTSPAPSSLVARSPSLELFRTGDSFNIEIRLATIPSLLENGEQEFVPMPKEYLGIRFPHEMVKRVSGRPALILSEMTYSLRMTMELGKVDSRNSEVSATEEEEESEEDCDENHTEDNVLLSSSACQACSKYLHEHRKLSPSRRSVQDPLRYPILQFSVPGGPSVSTSPQQQQQQQRQHQHLAGNTGGDTGSNNADQSGVVELRDGVCVVKAKVNCSSMHHLMIQREHAKRAAASRQQEQKEHEPEADQESCSTCSPISSITPSPSTAAAVTESAASTEPESSGPSSACLPLSSSPSTRRKKRTRTELQDPGFVFKFELIHPTLNTVVAQYNTQPILFQAYARGRV